MNKHLLFLSVTTPLILMLSACSGDDVSCSSDKVSEVLKETTMTLAKEQYIAEAMRKDHRFSSLMYATMMTSQRLGIAKTDPSTLDGYRDAEKKMKDAFKKSHFSLHDVRTTSKKDEIHKVSCVASATVSSSGDDYNFDLVYDAQKGDDSEKIYVDILEIN